MQGHGSSVSTLPENMSFDHGSTSDGGIDSQMSWNGIQTSAQNRLPAYRIPSTAVNVQTLHHPAGHNGLATNWNLGEASSSAFQNQPHHHENRKEHAWSVSSQAALTLEESRCETSNNSSFDNVVDVGVNGHPTTNGTSPLQISAPDPLPPDLNLHSRFGGHENDDCQVARRSNLYLSIGSSNEQVTYTGSSSDSLGVPSEFGGYLSEEGEDRSGCSLNGQRTSCKRKAIEMHTGQSSEPGSSNSFQHAERSQWPAVSAVQITPCRAGVPAQPENELGNNNGLERPNPRPRFGDGRAVSAGTFSLAANIIGESSHRNLRLRINGSPQPDHTPRNSSTEANVGNANVSSSPHASIFVPQSRLLDTNPAPHVENGSSVARSVLSSIPSVHRNPLLRWGGASGSRTSGLTALTNSRERDYALYEQSVSRNIPRSIMEHPVSVPASETGSSSQQPPSNWTFSGGSSGVAGNAASTSWPGSSSRVDSSAPSSSHRSRPIYNRRLSELVRRSLLSSPGSESGGQTSNPASELNSSTPSQGIANSSGSGANIPNSSNSRGAALLERHLDGDFRIPYLLRNLATSGEGRSNVMSEIRQVLDMMRRGGGDTLRLEDMMMLDHTVAFGIPDIHDRHRDMRLDVDNMSYEELLALEERIGNVCTGLNEDSITRHLKQKKYTGMRVNQDDQSDPEPCAICREEYNDGENLGTLECNHDFHTDCIKQWLMNKNLCPICKTTGLTT